MISVPERLETTEPLNRASRKRRAQYTSCQLMEDSVVQSATQFKKTEADRLMASRKSKRHLSATIFQGEGVGLPYLEAIRDLSLTMMRAKKIAVCAPHEAWLSRIVYTDYHRLPVNGLSLANIEKMPLPLVPKDISAITKFFRTPMIGLPYPNDQRVQEAAVYAAVEPSAHPELAVPSEIYPLTKCLTNFFEFYSSYLTAENTEPEQDRKFVNALMWTGNFFGVGLGLYTGASVGLSPSSVMKLFREHLQKSGFGWVTNSTFADINNEMQYAYHLDGENALPTKVHPYLEYDQVADKTMSSALSNLYSQRNDSDTSIFSRGEAEASINKLRRYRAVIGTDTFAEGHEFAQFKLDHSAIKEVIIAQRHSRSALSRNMVLVLLSDSPKAHLTLEITDNNRLLYGIPAELSKRVPHIEEFLARDIVGPILDQVEIRHPELKPRPRIEVTSKKDIIPTNIKPSLQDEAEAMDDMQIELPIKSPKRKRLRQAFDLVRVEPELPIKVQSYRRSSTVDHDEVLVKRLMSRASNEDVGRVMNAIKRFETGGVRTRKVVSEGGIFRVRTGNWRIMLCYQGGTAYTLTAVEDRKEAYK